MRTTLSPRQPDLLQCPKAIPPSLFSGFNSLKSPSQFSTVMLIASVVLLFGNAIAQDHIETSDGLGESGHSVSTLAVQVDEVALSFVVTDRHHRWIDNLSESELRLRDNGLPPESIRVFQRQADIPLRVGLLLDVSDSISQRFDFERDAAASFLSQIVDSSQDLAFVLGFNNKPALAQDFTRDMRALSSSVYKLDLGGTTAIYDAVYFACGKLLQHNDKGLTRRVLILLTDGDDNSSYWQPEQAIENAVRGNVTIIALHTDPDPDTSTLKYRTLEKLTKETGGQILRAGNKAEMAKAFEQLSLQLRNSYLLAYRPAHFERDGRYRKIQLKTTRRGVHIICRRGYYASGYKSSR